MKALTIWQPWASLIIAGAKPYEFRGWRAPRGVVGQRIAIHAGARPLRRNEVADLLVRLRSPRAWETALKPDIALPLLQRAYSDQHCLPLASVLGTAVLGEPRQGFEIVGEFGGKVNDSDRDQHSNWAWPLGNVEILEPFRPARGAQGFWDWHDA